MGSFYSHIVMFKHAVIAFSSLSIINAAAVLKSDSVTCAAPDGTNVDWVACGVDNAWYGVSKKARYTHWSAEFQLCAGLGGHVAWMNEEDEDTCAAQAMIQTNTIDEYVVLSGDYHEDVGEWMWPHAHSMTYFDWFPGSTDVANCMGAYYDGTTYGWIQRDCLAKSKAMCRHNC